MLQLILTSYFDRCSNRRFVSQQWNQISTQAWFRGRSTFSLEPTRDARLIPSLSPQGTVPARSHLNAIKSGGQQIGALLSAGTLSVQTPATYTATTSGSGFTLTTSKGNCGISGGQFTCGSGVTATVFGSVRIHVSQMISSLLIVSTSPLSTDYLWQPSPLDGQRVVCFHGVFYPDWHSASRCLYWFISGTGLQSCVPGCLIVLQLCTS
jgi:hypothetical protein